MIAAIVANLFQLLAAVAGALSFIGAVVLLVGLRGRRVDDHPICRKCRSDLFGVAAATTACPECGGAFDIENRKGVRFGNRAVRTRTLRAGATIVGLCLPILLASGYAVAKKIDPYPHLPLRVILWQIDEKPIPAYTDNTNPPGEHRARRELIARMQDPDFPLASRQHVIDHMLSLPANPHKGWLSRPANARGGFYSFHGNLLYREFDDVHMTREQRATYIENNLRLLRNVRPRVRAGSPLISSIGPITQRPLNVWMEQTPLQVSIIDGPTLTNLDNPPRPFSGTHQQYLQRGSAHYGWAEDLPSDITPGNYEVEYVTQTTVYSLNRNTTKGAQLHSFESREVFRVEIVASHQPTASYTAADGEIDTQMRDRFLYDRSSRSFDRRLNPMTDFGPVYEPPASLVVCPPLGTVVSNRFEHLRRSWYVTGCVIAMHPPTDAAFKVGLRINGQDPQAWSHHVFRANKQLIIQIGEYSAEEPKRVDVILKSDLSVAEETADLFEIWQGDIVFENVRLTPQNEADPRRAK